MLVVIAATGTLTYAPLQLAPVNTCIVGNIQDRLAARVPPDIKDIYLDARKIQFGFGSAAVGGWESLGEGVVIGGRVWLRTTHTASPHYYALVSNRYFQSNAFVYVPPDIESKIELNLVSGASFTQIWQQLAVRYPDGVTFAGYVKMKNMNAIAIAKPPITHAAIPENVPYYYTRPMESYEDVWTYVVGIHIGQLPRFNRQRRALYTRAISAGNGNSTGFGYAHVLRLKGLPFNRQTPPESVQLVSIGQLVDTSSVLEGRLQLYPIHNMAACSDALYPSTSVTVAPPLKISGAITHTTARVVSFAR